MEIKMPLEDFLNVYCDRCGSNFQSNSYHGVIDIIREHLLSRLNICKVENMKISSRTDKEDLNSLSSSPRLTIINSVVE
jgi:hypothetical protein